MMDRCLAGDFYFKIFHQNHSGPFPSQTWSSVGAQKRDPVGKPRFGKGLVKKVVRIERAKERRKRRGRGDKDLFSIPFLCSHRAERPVWPAFFIHVPISRRCPFYAVVRKNAVGKCGQRGAAIYEGLSRLLISSNGCARM